MPDTLSHTISSTREDPTPMDLDEVDAIGRDLVQVYVNHGYPRSAVTIQATGHDDLAGPVRTGDNYDGTEGGDPDPED